MKHKNKHNKLAITLRVMYGIICLVFGSYLLISDLSSKDGIDAREIMMIVLIYVFAAYNFYNAYRISKRKKPL